MIKKNTPNAPRRMQKDIDRRPLKNLRPHPKQQELFDDLEDAELQALAEDMKCNGQINAIEILPDGTIICGHQRLAAAKLLGWTELRCWVRHDLHEAGHLEVEERLIVDNLLRRQLGPLAVVRLYQRLKMTKSAALRNGKKGTLRDILGQQLGISGRNLQRHEQILSAPREVQRAVDRRELTLQQGQRIAALASKVQNRIAEELRKGKTGRDVVRKYLTAGTGARPKVPSIMAALDQVDQTLQGVLHLDLDLPSAQRQKAVGLLRTLRQRLADLESLMGQRTRSRDQTCNK